MCTTLQLEPQNIWHLWKVSQSDTFKIPQKVSDQPIEVLNWLLVKLQ